MAPTTAKALVIRVDGDKSSMDIKEIPIPKIESHQVLVRVGSVAQNPTDGMRHQISGYVKLANAKQSTELGWERLW